ncbi:MAG: DUF2845 domain-containing protein [Gammaproteobacteria bacterium]|nr:DUF2845 domain-containing protein [Gammaproteobacteria bacterium]
MGMDTEVHSLRDGISSRGRVAFAAAIGAWLLALMPCYAHADSMRCGSRIIKEDDPIEKVLEVCGEPVKRERTWIQRQPQYEVGDRSYSFPGREDVPVDLWTYDFGPNKLMQRVRFVAGKVESITTLGYGK